MPETVPKEELLAMAGRELPTSSWILVDQERIDRFADATEDHQFIHVDPEKAAETPFGATIAHGFLSLSLLAPLYQEVAVVPEGMVMAVNYGLNKVRFLQPVKAGSRVRMRARIAEVTERGRSRVLVASEAELEIEGEDKPALVAQPLTMYVVR